MKFNRFLIFLAVIVGGALGNLLLKPTFSLQQKALVLCVMVAYAGMFAYCNSLLERLEEERLRKGVLTLFGLGEEE